MSFKKKLFTTVGPLALAFIILGGIFLSPLTVSQADPKMLEKASTSMAVNVIKGNLIKNEAMAENNYVPFFGSSELSRFNAFHPSILAEKYKRDYRPFLLGAAGTQSLSQFLMLQSMGTEMQGKKAVFIISPQWFVKRGVTKEMFSLYYSPLQTYEWLIALDEVGETEKYVAKRLLKFTSVQSDTTMKTFLKQIKKGEELSQRQKKISQMKLKVLNREDQLFGHLGVKSQDRKIKKRLAELPEQYDITALDQLAYESGEKQTTTNEFQITNKFYNKRILPVKNSLAGSQAKFDYRDSIEYGDFQVFLAEVAKLEMEVLFVIPPVNGRWSEYTGLSTEMLDEFSLKINHQLKSQGFEHILDFTKDRNQDYFMEDTIHIGWRGWVELDKAAAPFLETAKADPVAYQLDDHFLTDEWRHIKPAMIE